MEKWVSVFLSSLNPRKCMVIYRYSEATRAVFRGSLSSSLKTKDLQFKMFFSFWNFDLEPRAILSNGHRGFYILNTALKDTSLKRAADCKLFLFTLGTMELREALAAFHRKYDGLDLDKNNFIPAPGSKELIYLIMNIFNGSKYCNLSICFLRKNFKTYKARIQKSSFVVKMLSITKWQQNNFSACIQAWASHSKCV